MEETQVRTKFCKFCGEKIVEDAILCTHCGRQVEQLKAEQQPQVIVNNTNMNTNTNTNTNINKNMGSNVYGRPKNKWIALALCFFLGFFGAHKFYEEKAGMGVLYLFTAGLFGIGVIIDFIALIFKPNTYYV